MPIAMAPHDFKTQPETKEKITQVSKVIKNIFLLKKENSLIK